MKHQSVVLKQQCKPWVIKKPSLVTAILISAMLYMIWATVQHKKMLPLAHLSSSLVPNSIKDTQFLRIKNGSNKSDSVPNNSASQQYSIKKNIIIDSHEILHGHKVKAQNSSITKNGKIYGSHLKVDSNELILGKASYSY